MNAPATRSLDINRRAALARLALPAAALALPGWAGAQARALRGVTVGGAVTEVVYLLGAQDQLIGCDTTSLYPPAALALPKVGYMRQLSAEGLLSLKPDWVVATQEAGPPVVLDQLRSAGVKLEVVRGEHDWSEVQRKVQAVGRVTGREAGAAALVQRLDQEWARAQQAVQAAPRKPRVLFILAHGSSPQVAGGKTAAHAVIGFAGGVNVLGGSFNAYRPMTAEAMAAAAPEVILTTTQGVEALGGEAAFWQRPELRLTPAYARRALVHMDALLLLGFGPRLPQAIAELHGRLLQASGAKA